MISKKIERVDAGQRLDKFIRRELPALTSGLMYKQLRKKNITLNGKKAEGKELLSIGDEICFFFSDETYAKFAGDTAAVDCIYRKAYQTLQGMKVLYEDDDVVIMDKPAGVLSQQSKVSDLSANEWLCGYLLEKKQITEQSLTHFKPSVCNRLDRMTCGLLLGSKSLPGARYLSRVLQDRSVHKFYRTYVWGKPEAEDCGVKTAYLWKDEKKNRVYISERFPGEEGEKKWQKICTSWRVEAYDARHDISRLEVELLTGKSHQIRAHLAWMGYPILGDVKYQSAVEGSKRLDADRYLALEEKLRLPKYQLLQAARMVFPAVTDAADEPSSICPQLAGKEFRAPLPVDFQSIEERLCLPGIPED